MIEIIKRGTKQIYKCDYCGCKFSYEDEDTYHYEYDVDGDYDKRVNGYKHGYKLFIDCPQCNEQIKIIN